MFRFGLSHRLRLRLNHRLRLRLPCGLRLRLSHRLVCIVDNLTTGTPRTELIEQHITTVIRVDHCKLSLSLRPTQILTYHTASSDELIQAKPTVATCIDLIKLIPQIVEVHQILKQKPELLPTNPTIFAHVSSLVCSHQRWLMVEVRPHL